MRVPGSGRLATVKATHPRYFYPQPHLYRFIHKVLEDRISHGILPVWGWSRSAWRGVIFPLAIYY